MMLLLDMARLGRTVFPSFPLDNNLAVGCTSLCRGINMSRRVRLWPRGSRRGHGDGGSGGGRRGGSTNGSGGGGGVSRAAAATDDEGGGARAMWVGDGWGPRVVWWWGLGLPTSVSLRGGTSSGGRAALELELVLVCWDGSALESRQNFVSLTTKGKRPGVCEGKVERGRSFPSLCRESEAARYGDASQRVATAAHG